MTVADFLLPVFVQVFLIFVVMVLMARARAACISQGEVKIEDIALDNRNYTPRARQFANNFSNQFELPVLFFVLIAFILITRVFGTPLLVLAWIFVLSRIAHAFVHVTSNNVMKRLAAYSVGALVLFIMWLIFAIQILTAA
jgi:hypothetical protein